MATAHVKLSIGRIDGMRIPTASSRRHSSRDHAVSKGHQIDTKQFCPALYPFLRTASRKKKFRILPVENMKQRFAELRRGHQAYQCPKTHRRRQRDFR